jgi:hypothetical protein
LLSLFLERNCVQRNIRQIANINVYTSAARPIHVYHQFIVRTVDLLSEQSFQSLAYAPKQRTVRLPQSVMCV